MSSQSGFLAIDSDGSEVAPDHFGILSMADLDHASLLAAAGDDSLTGEANNFVPTGVIGAEWRAAQDHADCAKAFATAQSSSRASSKPLREFKDIRKLNVRETEQTLNVMVVGEAGMGKSTLVESFFKTFREQDEGEHLVDEDSWRVKEKKQLLTSQENMLREAEKEKRVLLEADKLTEAEEQRKRISQMGEVAAQMKAEIEVLRQEDRELREQLEAIKRDISGLKQRKKAAKDADRLTEAQQLKLEIEANETAKKELAGRLQRQGNGEPEGDERSGAEAAPGGQGHSPLVNEPTVEVTAKPAFYIKHRVADQPPVNLKVTLIDTPGYGENTNLETTFRKIVEHVVERFKSHRAAEEKQMRRGADLSHSDPLVHCVLYFIAPHRLKPVDIAFMKELHQKVNIIPIVAKSDTMTTEEKRDFKVKVRELLEAHGVNTFEFHKPTLDHMSAQAQVAYEHPWAVIATKNAKVNDDGVIEAKRVYDWGAADADNPQHSDLLALRTLILGDAEAWRDLKQQTFAKYESWRAEAIETEHKVTCSPWTYRMRAKALRCYAKVPPMYMMALVVLLVGIIVVPLVGQSALRLYARSATLEYALHEKERELNSSAESMSNCERDVAKLKFIAREWHGRSKAWYFPLGLEPLPKAFEE